jgi:hypothetical protein
LSLPEKSSSASRTQSQWKNILRQLSETQNPLLAAMPRILGTTGEANMPDYDRIFPPQITILV